MWIVSFFCDIFQNYVTESYFTKLKYSSITMFYGMKSVVMFVAASLILVIGIVAIALPNPVQAV